MVMPVLSRYQSTMYNYNYDTCHTVHCKRQSSLVTSNFLYYCVIQANCSHVIINFYW